MAGGLDALLISALEADEQDWKRLDREEACKEHKEFDFTRARNEPETALFLRELVTYPTAATYPQPSHPHA
jgi:hypothetical protein